MESRILDSMSSDKARHAAPPGPPCQECPGEQETGRHPLVTDRGVGVHVSEAIPVVEEAGAGVEARDCQRRLDAGPYRWQPRKRVASPGVKGSWCKPRLWHIAGARLLKPGWASKRKRFLKPGWASLLVHTATLHISCTPPVHRRSCRERMKRIRAVNGNTGVYM